MNNLIFFIYKLKKYLKQKLPRGSFLYELAIVIPQKMVQDSERCKVVHKELSKYMNSENFPIFTTIEIETVNRCNGECAFCPVNRHDDKRKYQLMSRELFDKIIKELKDINYDGRLQIFSNNEPFMDKRICELVKYAKTECPNTHMSFFTNGILLDEEKFNSLIPYCDTFCIDVYYDTKAQLPANIKRIAELCISNPELKKKVIISMIDRNAIRNNRGGQSKNRHFVYKLKTACKLPFQQVIVRPDGKLSLCCNDAMGKYTLGDLTEQSLMEIWNSKTYTEIRKNLLNKGRSSIKLCEYCDNFGGFGTNASKDYIFTAGQFAASWKNIDELLNSNEDKN